MILLRFEYKIFFYKIELYNSMIYCQENNSLMLNWKATLNNLVSFSSVKTPTSFHLLFILHLPLISNFSQMYSLWRIITLKYSLCFWVVPLSNSSYLFLIPSLSSTQMTPSAFLPNITNAVFLWTSVKILVRNFRKDFSCHDSNFVSKHSICSKF